MYIMDTSAVRIGVVGIGGMGGGHARNLAAGKINRAVLGAVCDAVPTHFTNFHTAANVRYGQDYTQGSSALLQYLISQAAIPEYQVRWRWQPGDIAMWDNRSTQHYAVMDYPPSHRKMERAGIVGEATY